jgi:RHS repeat-associated protein
MSEPMLRYEYNIFRWYRGGWGRYTQADPLSQAPMVGPAGTEPDIYFYAKGNPVSTIDPDGLCPRCGDCPSGEWTISPVGFGVSGAIGWGRSWTVQTYTCRDNGYSVTVQTSCSLVGFIIGGGAGIPIGKACACNAQELINNGAVVKGQTIWIGPLSIDPSKCGNQTVASGGVSKSWGGGWAATRCTSQIVRTVL